MRAPLLRVVLCVLFAVAPAALGADARPLPDQPEPVYGNIAKGRWKAGAASNFQIYSTAVGKSSVTSVLLSTGLQYFLNDEFSLGGVLDFFKQEDYRAASFGPALTYFPWKEGRYAIPFTTAVLFETTRNSLGTTFNNAALDFSVGVDYFVTPAVALGPRLFYAHRFKSGTVSASDTFALLATFTLYL